VCFLTCDLLSYYTPRLVHPKSSTPQDYFTQKLLHPKFLHPTLVSPKRKHTHGTSLLRHFNQTAVQAHVLFQISLWCTGVVMLGALVWSHTGVVTLDALVWSRLVHWCGLALGALIWSRLVHWCGHAWCTGVVTPCIAPVCALPWRDQLPYHLQHLRLAMQ